NRQRDTRQSCAGADVEQRGWLDPGGHGQGVEQVTNYHLFGGAHGGEVVGRVPALQQRHVGEQLFVLRGRQRQAERRDALGQQGRLAHDWTAWRALADFFR